VILHKLVVKNFRQFRGIQKIRFVPKDDEQEKKVTVIYGENGRGKTGIFRAIMFCLYGDQRLSQDSHVTEKELSLVNVAELHATNNPVECFVQLDFSHSGYKYSLKRTMLGMKDKDEIIEQRDKVRLTQQTAPGNSLTIDDPREIGRIINSILDQRVREYFLFDGEKIERLTRASPEQRREVAGGLRNLLHIDALEVAIKATARLQKRLDTELEKKSTGQYAKIINQIKQNTERHSQIETRIEGLETEISNAVEEKRKLDEQFEKIREISDLLRDRNELEDREREIQDQLSMLLTEIKTHTGRLSLVLVSDTVNTIFDHIDQRKKRGEIPSEIRKDLIEKILLDQMCICGRETLPNSEPYYKIIEWKHRSNEAAIEDFMLDLWRILSAVKNHYGDVVFSAETLLQRYAITKNDIEKVRIALSELNSKIGSSEREDAAKLQKTRELLEGKIIQLNANRAANMSILQDLQQEHEGLLAQRKEKEREEGIKNELSRRAALVFETHQALKEVYNEFTQDIKTAIGKSATEFFKKLIDSEGVQTLQQIIVNEDYSIQILDRWEKPFLANISAGQRQIMSISFIAALAKAAATGDIFEMPFFMDSPFGRLSNEHRRNLIEHVPKFASQWILLATDTEFRRYEAGLLRKTGGWGCFYILKGEGPGATRIIECEIEDAFTFLKDEGQTT